MFVFAVDVCLRVTVSAREVSPSRDLVIGSQYAVEDSASCLPTDSCRESAHPKR